MSGPTEKFGQNFGSANVIGGRKEGFAWIFHPEKYPNGVVGKVSFLWKPVSGSDETRNIWIWSHPSFYDEFWQILKSVFAFEEKKETITDEEGPPKKKLKFCDVILEQKLAPKNIPGDEKIPKFVGKIRETAVHAFHLKDSLNRFRLVGPLSQSILNSTLQLSTICHPEVKKENGDVEMADTENNNENVFWWKNYFKQDDKTAEDFVEKESSFWSKFNRFLPGEIPPGFSFSLIVRDPRKLLPPKRGCEQVPIKGKIISFCISIPLHYYRFYFLLSKDFSLIRVCLFWCAISNSK